MKTLCFTIDLDRDVNICLPGHTPAGSMDRGSGTAPRFDSTSEGLPVISELLDDLHIKGTFFAEGKTLESIDATSFLSGHEIGMHGYEHEDLTGSNGIEYERFEKKAILLHSSDVVNDITGIRPQCFRAPYMKIGQDVIDILPEIGIKYDSSFYTKMTGTLTPSKMKNGVYEVSVPEGHDAEGKKIAAYLWPMHEGRRVPEDYISLASQLNKGIFVLATHTWHMSESRKNGKMTSEEMMANIDNTRKVLEGILDLGFVAKTIPDAVRPYE
ncbi:MAG: polysaccharide deacetylase family protein [Candidatus Methanomethylophilaceae archaeon]|nr:polysaccharide deacetylase family protein [Candidatus Methanomethylophilaceae archaeon]MDD3378372.1 polysaccharide deacetylase family protein [Candidatus Methanomethylophilaceae archaeon]MDY0223880.1 polysaccharide deacetylase family protein [Candidatus Methanomethylophilaceae archaeon]